ncbi:MAG: hypothetical protein A2270_05630 [Elusimicrobia bacterium RIFOXYA12_FULL_51_18]|nr:MAG: hypothetical protein A2270_05630 [Elusimicrobia bacterium RIFOXYA12_FULL_51_18]OGS28697.1 MAG: hypothetical protein A2218_11035 [Elusimicrobia bacterium RIFOXYA2_FULL_53_38]
MKQRRGIALVVVNLLAVFLLPFVLYLMLTSNNFLKNSFREKQQKLSGSLASGVLVDFMRQFSQSYYEGHYDTESLSRNPVFRSVGFSSVDTEADAQGHRLYIHASGQSGSSAAAPLADKNLYGTVQFISDLTDYGTLIDGTFTLGKDNALYMGKWWITGNLTISGDNVTFMGGPLIVGGNLTVTGSNVRINGDIYYEGTLTGTPVVSGTKYNFYPSDMTYPSIRRTYHQANYNYKITADPSVIRFNAYPSSSTFSLIGTTITVPVTEAGMIIYGENVNLTLYGTVRGRVTVVTSNTSGTKGKITIGLFNQNANLLYYDPLTGGTTTSAVSGNSFAALPSNGLTFQGKTTTPAADLTVCGVYFDGSANNISTNGNSSKKLYLYGTRNKPVDQNFSSGVYTYDPWLNTFPPPGLPERPVLVTWHLR